MGSAPAYGGARVSGNRPSGGSAGSDIQNHGARVPSTGSHSGGGHSGVRPDNGSHHGGAASGGVRPDGARRPSGGSNYGGHAGGPSANSRSYADGNHSPRNHGGPAAHRPAPGHRPGVAPGAGRIHVNPRPGHHMAPRHREPIALRGNPAHFHVYGHHNYGHYITVLPRYEIRHYWGRDYYYYDNIWYRYYSGRYWVCRPPFGYVFSPLADAVYTACRFAYYFDNLYYYNTINDNARTIQEQNSTIAANNALIAQQNANIAMNSSMAAASGSLAQSLGLVQSYANAGGEYFYNDGVFYTKGADGQYVVIVPPAGAIVDKLPDDFEVVELGGGTYYKVDDTIYRMIVSADGDACFEVLGQLVS